MNIAWPPEMEGRFTAAQTKLHLAVGLFAGDEVTLGQAAAIAEMPQPAFLQELGKRKIPVHYGPVELDEDIATCARCRAVQRQLEDAGLSQSPFLPSKISAMNREAIREWLNRRPFEPFVLRLSNGEVHEVRHTENLALGKTRSSSIPISIGPCICR